MRLTGEPDPCRKLGEREGLKIGIISKRGDETRKYREGKKGTVAFLDKVTG
jgi:hypothetical protein